MALTDSITAGVGVSAETDMQLAVKNALLDARAPISEKKIAAAIIFTSAEFARTNAVRIISNLLGPVPIIGATGAAIISHHGITQHGLGIMLLALPKTIYFNTAETRDIQAKGALAAGAELAESLLRNFPGLRRDLGIIFSDGLLKDGSSLIYGLQERLGTSFPLIGASAADNLQFSKTYVYFNQEANSDAACGLVLGGRLNYGLGIKHGWKPLGKPRLITKSLANIIYEIDGQPAARIYENYLGKNLEQLKKELKRISIFYPLGMPLAGEKEYILRNIHAINDDGSLACQGDIPQGSTVRLMIGTKESCLLAAKEATAEVNNGLRGKKADFAFVFDSVSRYSLLGRNAAKELEILRGGLGEGTPFLGLYTYGEQAPLKAIGYQGRTYFHNQTITILGIAG